MSRCRGAILGLWIAGCAHRVAPASTAFEAAPDAPVVHDTRRVVGPARWSDGVVAEIPPGWFAEAVPPAAVTITDPLTQANVAVFLDAPAPDVRAGMLRLFDDDDTWRRVPLLYPGGSETWLSRDPRGPTLMVWYGSVNGRPIHLDLSAPPNELVHALERFQPILTGIGLP